MSKTEAVTLMTDETFEEKDAATAADAKQGSKQSELRTVRAITNQLPDE